MVRPLKYLTKSYNYKKSVGIIVLIAGCLAIAALYATKLNWAIWFYPFWTILLIPVMIKRFSGLIGILAIRCGIPFIIAILTWAAFRYVENTSYLKCFAIELYKDNATIDTALSILSTLHAITFAFCLWKAMQDFDDLKDTLRDEANQILSISSLLRFFDNVNLGKTQENLSKIRMKLNSYVSNMIDDAQSDVYTKNSKILSDCIDHLECFEIEHDNDRIALESIVKGFSDLIMIRSKRISCLHNNMSPLLFFIIAVMSASIVAMFFVINPVGFEFNEIIIPLISFTYSFLLVMLIDLDRPFDGFWQVSVDAFESIDLNFRKNIDLQERP